MNWIHGICSPSTQLSCSSSFEMRTQHRQFHSITHQSIAQWCFQLHQSNIVYVLIWCWVFFVLNKLLHTDSFETGAGYDCRWMLNWIRCNFWWNYTMTSLEGRICIRNLNSYQMECNRTVSTQMSLRIVAPHVCDPLHLRETWKWHISIFSFLFNELFKEIFKPWMESLEYPHQFR